MSTSLAGGLQNARHFGSYHRLRSPTQTLVTANEQVQSQRILGRAARWSSRLSVKAYRGPLPPNAEGIEFETPVAPSPGSHPTTVYWYEGTAGVTVINHKGDDFDMINVTVRRHVYP